MDGPGRSYFERRRGQGDTYGMAMRCLKRRVCRVVYRRLQIDYLARPQSVTSPVVAGTAVTVAMPAWMQLLQVGQTSGEGGGTDEVLQ
jgi:hypothetical protein